MIDFYLVTGFLGAGKTTFLKNFVRLFAEKKMYLIINEFGSQGIDGELVRELGLAMAEINNGSIFCACRLDKFEAELHNAVNEKPQVIITEASGLADPTNVRKVLHNFEDINYKGAVCIADAVRLIKVYSTAEVSRRQLAVSSLVLLNKVDIATGEQQEKTCELIKQANPAATIKPTTFGQFMPEWFSLLSPEIDLDEVLCSPDITLQKTTLIVNPEMTSEQLLHTVKLLTECTYRIKGLIATADGPRLVDCTGPQVSISPWNGEVNDNLVLLAGQGMPLREGVKNAIKWYPNLLTKKG